MATWARGLRGQHRHPRVAGWPEPAHSYVLGNGYADQRGGPALVPTGGTLGPDGWTFGAGTDHLSVAGAFGSAGAFADHFTLRLEWLLLSAPLAGDALEFQTLLYYGPDGGFVGVYYDPNMGGVGITKADGSYLVIGGGRLPTLTSQSVFVTRDRTTKVVTLYVDGHRLGQATDTDGDVIMTQPAQAMTVMEASVTPELYDSATGVVSRFTIYDRPLTPVEVWAAAHDL